MPLHSPFTNVYPYWVWGSMAKSRRGKDVFDSSLRIFNKTGIYEYILKRNSTFWGFVVFLAMTSGFVHGRAMDRLYQNINKGYLYKDNLYKWPVYEEEVEDEEEEESDGDDDKEAEATETSEEEETSPSSTDDGNETEEDDEDD